MDTRQQPERIVRLGERDVSLLADLWCYGLMLRDQIHALHFTGCALRRLNRRLKLLADAGFIASAPLLLGPLADPTQELGAPCLGQRVYRLSPHGERLGMVELLSCRLGLDADRVRRRLHEVTGTGGSSSIAAHTLEVIQVRIALQRAATLAAIDGIRIDAFLAEPLLYHAYEVHVPDAGPSNWRTEVFKPDALCVLSSPANAPTIASRQIHYLFLEVDLSYDAIAEMTHKMQMHATYLRTGLFASRYAAASDEKTRVTSSPTEGFRTLVLTTGRQRARRLKEIAEAAGFGFLWFAALSDYARAAIRGQDCDESCLFRNAIWEVPFARKRKALLPMSDNSLKEVRSQ